MMGVREIDWSLEQWQMDSEGLAEADGSGAHAPGAGAMYAMLLWPRA